VESFFKYFHRSEAVANEDSAVNGGCVLLYDDIFPGEG
jgi:hypothetical protein